MASRWSLGRECNWSMTAFKQERYRRDCGAPPRLRLSCRPRSAYVLLMETIMLSPLRQFRPNLCRQRGSGHSRAGFTLVEIVIALAVLGTMAAGCFIGFNSVNTYAVSSRLYSEAQTAAQNQIDLILSREPFDIMISPARVPLELMTGAELAAQNPALGSSTPATTNSYYPYYLSNGLLARDAFIYTDPVTGNMIVKGIVTTQVTDVNATETLEATTMGLNIRRATVTVSYNFRNTNYKVVMDTMRTADR
jgi:prepilin-type N-terminal cleavage/methylation domain-containing protein